MSDQDERKLDELDTEDKSDSVLALKLVAILLLERALLFLVICSCAIVGYSEISEFINGKDKYFIVENPMSDVG